MKSFIKDQMLIVRQSRKDLTLQKSPCNHNSEIARLTEEIAYLRYENRTKSCIIQTNDKQKVAVKSFRGAETSQMHLHAKPTIEKNPENIIIHCSTNDTSKGADPEKIAADVINLSKSISEETGSNVIISGLFPRKEHLNEKVRNVNNMLVVCFRFV